MATHHSIPTDDDDDDPVVMTIPFQATLSDLENITFIRDCAHKGSGNRIYRDNIISAALGMLADHFADHITYTLTEGGK